jgi:uncharacterized membrane protein YheB (UPF0754 family)
MDSASGSIRREEVVAHERLANLNSDFSNATVEEFKNSTSASIKRLEENSDQKYGKITAGVLADRLREFVETVDLLFALVEEIKTGSVAQDRKLVVLEICEQLKIIASLGGVLHTLIYSVLRKMKKQNIESVETMAK